MDGPVTLTAPDQLAADYFDHAAALAALESGAPLVFPPMQVTHVTLGGRPLVFCANYDRDPIQKTQRKGDFYERPDLEEIAKYLEPGARVLDVGANVGNHALYFATQCGAESVLVIEPNPLAQAPLVANVVLNNLQDVIRLEALGIGLGARSERGFSMTHQPRNLGGARMQAGKGALDVHPGDALFADEHFDLVKIDVEGMEMAVLEGLAETIARCRPLIFIEVDESHAAAFDAWCTAHRYTTRYEVRRYAANVNVLIQPIGEKA